MSLRLTVRLGTGEEQVVDCLLEGKEPISITLELADHTRDNRNALVAHDGRSPGSKDDAVETGVVPESRSPIEADGWGSGIYVHGYNDRAGLLGHFQISPHGLKRS